MKETVYFFIPGFSDRDPNNYEYVSVPSNTRYATAIHLDVENIEPGVLPALLVKLVDLIARDYMEDHMPVLRFYARQVASKLDPGIVKGKGSVDRWRVCSVSVDNVFKL